MAGYCLTAFRHAKSNGNEKGIIQGWNSDAGLSEEGQLQLQASLDNRFLGSRNIDHIFSSDLLRAEQTAKAISASIKVPFYTDSLLREVNSGILSGHDKSWAHQYAPDALAIWGRYGDLDGIPGAETGDQLQARAVGFLTKILQTTVPGHYAVVSHAAFIRSLVNTVRINPRTTPVGHEHLSPIDCEDIFSGICPTKMGPTFTSSVFKVHTHEGPYTVKILTDANEHSIQPIRTVSTTLAEVNLGEPLLHGSTYVHEGISYALVVSKYIPGSALTEIVSPNDFEDICDVTLAVSGALQTMHTNKGSKEFTDLRQSVGKIAAGLEVADQAELSFINSMELHSLFNERSGYTLVDHDCHRGNYIRRPDGKVRKIDISPLLAPSIYQPASLLLSAFLLNSASLDDSRNLYSKFMATWPNLHGQEKAFISAMKLRACLGISYFNRYKRKSGGSGSADEIALKYKSTFQKLDYLT